MMVANRNRVQSNQVTHHSNQLRHHRHLHGISHSIIDRFYQINSLLAIMACNSFQKQRDDKYVTRFNCAS